MTLDGNNVENEPLSRGEQIKDLLDRVINKWIDIKKEGGNGSLLCERIDEVIRIPHK